MKLKITLSALIYLSLLVIPALKANAQTYLPVGPQTNVLQSTITNGGWFECYRDTYDVPMDADAVLSACQGSRLMLTCRETGSSLITLLAQGERSDVTFDTGLNQGVLHLANGVGWYFNNDPLNGAWGFVQAGDSVFKTNCDTDSSGANDERLCWHLNDFGGYRCGATTDLNDSSSFERVVYQEFEAPPPVVEAIPTLSEWGLMVMAGFLGIAGLIVMRRRKLLA